MSRRRKRTLSAAIMGLLIAAVSAVSGIASPGDRDTTFGGGVVVTTLGDPQQGATARVYKTLTLPDGRILAVGTDGERFAAARYRNDGSLDPAWGNSGLVKDDVGQVAYSAALQNDGRLVVVGSAAGAGVPLVVARYLADGSPDASFGSGGHLTVQTADPSNTSPIQEATVQVQADGKIVVAIDQALYRWLGDGTSDSTFGVNGKATTVHPATGLAQQTSGALLVSYFAPDGVDNEGQFHVRRYSANGSLDVSYGTNGVASMSVGYDPRGPRDLVVQPDDKALLVGALADPNNFGFHDFLVVRFTADGQPDCAFGSGGRVTTDFPHRTGSNGTDTEDIAAAAAIEPDGRLLVGGQNTYGLALARYTANGHLDPSFGQAGTLVVDSPTDSMLDRIEDIAVGADGKLAVVGDNGGAQANYKTWIVGRFLPESGPAGIVPYQTACNPTNPPATALAGRDDLGGVAIGGPDAVSWAPGRVDVFVRGGDNQLWHKWWDGSAWRGWEPLGGVLASDPSVASWSPNRLDVFVRGTDNVMWHRWWDGAAWRGWEPLGAPGQSTKGLTSEPEAAAWGPRRLDVFGRGPDGAMWHTWWDGAAWRGWESLGGNLASGPTATSVSPGSLDVFAQGTDNVVWHKAYGSGWSNWSSLGFTIRSSPDASTPTRDGTEPWRVAAAGTDNGLWLSGGPGPWEESFPGEVTSGPSVVQWGPGRLDLFFRGADQHIWHGWRGS